MTKTPTTTNTTTRLIPHPDTLTGATFIIIAKPPSLEFLKRISYERAVICSDFISIETLDPEVTLEGLSDHNIRPVK